MVHPHGDMMMLRDGRELRTLKKACINENHCYYKSIVGRGGYPSYRMTVGPCHPSIGSPPRALSAIGRSASLRQLEHSPQRDKLLGGQLGPHASLVARGAAVCVPGGRGGGGNRRLYPR